VQDLQPSILFLLSLLSLKQIIFCGDTAQTIIKGLQFRFSDLKKLFFYYKDKENYKKSSYQNPLLLNPLQFSVLRVKKKTKFFKN